MIINKNISRWQLKENSLSKRKISIYTNQELTIEVNDMSKTQTKVLEEYGKLISS